MKVPPFIVSGNCQWPNCQGTQIEVIELGPDNAFNGRCLKCGKPLSGGLYLRVDDVSKTEPPKVPSTMPQNARSRPGPR
jgi:PHP family Zn ribbon phosphoesterase